MILFPAIDLKDGQVVRLLRGSGGLLLLRMRLLRQGPDTAKT